MAGLPLFLIVLASLFFSSFDVHAGEDRIREIGVKIPEDDVVQVLTTEEGTRHIGRIIRIGDKNVEFKSEYGILTIPKSRIRSVREVPENVLKNGKFWLPDPNITRLYFAPTGRMLPKGGGYIADYYLFFPTINYGVSENVSLGGGFSLFPTGNMRDQIYFITPKIGLKKAGRFSLAAGALVVKIPESDDEDTSLVSVLYSVGTYGSPDLSFTVGFGYGMVDTDLADKPMVVLGGEKRLTRRTAFITENWIFPGVEHALVSYGIRFFGDRMSVDLALLNITGSEALFPGIPYVDFVYNYGTSR